MIKKAIYPGTFDPPTLGHVDIVKRCSCFVDKLYLGVGLNSNKPQVAFSCEERVALLKRLFKENPQIEVVAFKGLLVDFVAAHSIALVIRSIRTASDVDFEIAQASLNRQMTGIETLWISAAPQYRDLSSTLVQEIARAGKSLDRFVPSPIVKEVENRLANQ